MPEIPEIQSRDEQPYVAIRTIVTMQSIVRAADRTPDVYAWLAANGIAPAGPPFLKYNVIDMARDLELEAGVPVDGAVAGDGEVLSGTLPAGRFATVTHLGHPDELADTTGDLLAWAGQQGLRFDVSDGPVGERWGAELSST